MSGPQKELKIGFRASKCLSDDGGLPAMVEKSLKQFQATCPLDARRGQASVIATVSRPEDDTYFTVVIAGPFANLETLQACMTQLGQKDFREQLGRLGIS